MYLKSRNVAILTEVHSPRARSMSTSRYLLKCSEKAFPPSLQAQGPASEGSPKGSRVGPVPEGKKASLRTRGPADRAGLCLIKRRCALTLARSPSWRTGEAASCGSWDAGPRQRFPHPASRTAGSADSGPLSLVHCGEAGRVGLSAELGAATPFTGLGSMKTE